MLPSNEYDGIIVGGGHQGLVCAAYLARAGLDIAVLEQSLHVGGGAHTADVTGRGFRFNLCSKGHYNVSGTPWYHDLELERHGLEYLHSETEFALPRGDDDPIVLGSDTEATLESIARYSQRDAEQFAELREIANELMEKLYLPQRFDEPIPADERRDLLKSSELGRTFLRWSSEPVVDLLEEWFESEQLILLLLEKIAIFGQLGAGADEPNVTGGIVRLFESDYGYDIARGGSQMLAIALQQAIQKNGGTVLTNREVDSITVNDGRATGVTLENGRAFEADFVVSGVNPRLTFKRLTGYESIPRSLVDKVENFEFEKRSVVSTHFALDEAPDFTGSDETPALNDALYQLVGIEERSELEAAMEAVGNKELAPGGFLGAVYTRLDDTVAPEGKHIACSMQPAAYDLHGDPEKWEEVIPELEAQFLDTWREYAPNMTEDNVIATNTWTPHHINTTNPNMYRGRSLIGEDNQNQVLDRHFGYRTAVDDLYMCGCSTHPGAGINGGAGYIAAKVIHEDLGMHPWWEPVDARAALEAL